MNPAKPLYKDKVFRLFLVGIGLFFLMSFYIHYPQLNDNNEWTAPAWTDTLTNPYKNDVQAVQAGKEIYNKYCWSCHGKDGKGHGPAATNLNPKPADHTSEKIQNESDGALFWKITTGNPPMASYENTLSEDERWKVVTYIKSLN